MSDWTMKNDTQSVHVGINHRIWLCRQNKERPVKILLGKEHTKLFMYEKGWKYIPRGPHFYGTFNIPMEFNVPHIYGIAMISEPIPARERKGRKRAGNADEKDL